MAAPNIVDVTTITGKTAVLNVTTSATAIVTNSAASGLVYKINSIIIANIDGTSDASVTVDLFRSSVAYHLAKTIVVPADSTLVLPKDMALYLEEGDSLRCAASASGDLQALCTYEVIG